MILASNISSGLASCPTLTPTEGNGNKEKRAHWVPSTPHPRHRSWEVPVPRRPFNFNRGKDRYFDGSSLANRCCGNKYDLEMEILRAAASVTGTMQDDEPNGQGFQRGRSGNPGGRPKLPADIREAFKAKAPQALEVLTRCLQSDDDRIAMMAAQAILDRGYGKPTQSIDANINDDPVRYIVELPEKSATTEEWLESIRREDAGRALVTGVAAADDEQTH